MTDIKNVIKGIRKCLSHKPCNENGCPYEDLCAVEHLKDPLLRDTLELLKEQDVVEPKTGHWIDTTKVIGFPRVECSACGSGAGASWMVYCPMCGSKNIT